MINTSTSFLTPTQILYISTPTGAQKKRPMAMTCWRVVTRMDQLSMAATTRVEGDIGGLWTPQHCKKNMGHCMRWNTDIAIFFSLMILASTHDNTWSMMHSAVSVAAFSEWTVLIFPHVYHLNWLWPIQVAEVKLLIKEKGLGLVTGSILKIN